MTYLDRKGSPGDMLIKMLGGGGLMDIIQSGGQFPSATDYMQGEGLMSDPQDPALTDEQKMQMMMALDQLMQNDKLPNMSQAYAAPPEYGMSMSQPDNSGLQSLMNMIGSVQPGERQRPGQAYINQYLQSLMG